MTKIEESIANFVIKIYKISFKHQCSITSWIRTVKRNKLVGGDKNSKHLIAFGMDLVPDSWPKVDPLLLQDIKKYGLFYSIEEDHIHVQGIKPGKSTI